MTNVNKLVEYSNKILGYESVVDEHADRIVRSIKKEGKEASYNGREIVIESLSIPVAKELFIRNNVCELIAKEVNSDKVEELLVDHIEELLRRGRFSFV